MTALDGDRGNPNDVEYSFLAGSNDFFDLDNSTGVISIGSAGLDREDPTILNLYGVLEFTVLVSTLQYGTWKVLQTS